jgi:shikimate kinase
MKQGPVFLVGMMGAGKTSLGEYLGIQTGHPFLDTDAAIVAQSGKSILQIFQTEGESAFRAMELACFETISSESQWIATGGGFPCHHDLMVKMKSLGTVLYLKLEPEELWNRLEKDDSRPLLKTENPLEVLKARLKERAEIYEQAHFIIDGNQSLSDLFQEIEGLGLI